jgi:uncharacterized protein YbcI
MRQSKGQVEAAIRNAVIRFEMEFLGRGPTDVRAYILQDLIIVRLKGVLTPAEQQLAKNPEGVTLVKRMRSNLLDQGRDDLIKEISSLTGAEVVGLFTDVHVASGERVIVLTMDVNLEQRFLPSTS